MQHETSFIDFAHVSLLFLRSSNRILASKRTTQQKKLIQLVKSNISMQDPSKVIFNFSKYELSDYEIDVNPSEENVLAIISLKLPTKGYLIIKT